MSDEKKIPPLVERRQAFADKQARAGKGVLPGWAEGLPIQGSGEGNRHGMPKLPVGQRAVPNWPVLDLGHQPEIAREEWRFSVSGLVAAPFTVGFDELTARFPVVDEESDFHCVTTWSKMDMRFTGVRVRDVIAAAAPDPRATHVLVTAYDEDFGSGEPYTTNLPLAAATEPDVLLVFGWEGRPLPREHGGPVRMVTPRLYAWKGAKWVRSIEVLDHDEPGFWERRGYSNTALPWFDDRYRRRGD